ncbi:alpha/beta fold hydrolase [Pseudomonas violetae]|jgi:pimeloyl-ACP methyl ester carboxylesterase|uniref:Alpha/beta hydrolase n=1 Tax=Pseudomonas violetae TaxID=2915813 RepID=A0ABT0EXG1_9PSED|nr:alpha/beta hydrolase [Pseudomonas violetae]MCK1790304.1 alpha/beta hydrolase [Pseudomonas violetae]
MNKLFSGLALAAAMITATAAMAAPVKPTVVLVHGAFADSSSWNGVVKILEKDGYPVIAASNPLRSLKGDAQSVADVLASIKTPIVLVGHSYGGPVISEAAYGNANVKALVFVAAIAPEAGESTAALSGRFPGGTLGPTLAPPIALADGGKDLYIQQEKFHDQFAADVSIADARVMAATQRPVTAAALNEASTEPAWKTIPSWFVYGTADKNIPAQAQVFMAERAQARQTVAVKGASHVVMVSNPKVVASLIEKAANAK